MELKKIESVVNEYLKDKDIELVAVTVGVEEVIEVEIDAVRGVTLEECAELSRHIESCFDRDKEDFELTVASYSISAPFKTVLQYRKNVGRDVEVTMQDEEVIKSKLSAVGDENFTVEYDEKVVVEGKKRKELQHFTREINYKDVKSTKLLF
ncbi:MAG: ribosome assembly cofactor RimP [Rikenellaceae bacterium]